MNQKTKQNKRQSSSFFRPINQESRPVIGRRASRDESHATRPFSNDAVFLPFFGFGFRLGKTGNVAAVHQSAINGIISRNKRPKWKHGRVNENLLS